MMNRLVTKNFLQTKIRALSARARRLTDLTPVAVGIRPQDKPYAPSRAHFETARERLKKIERAIEGRLTFLHDNWRDRDPREVLVYIALVEREVDRARRAFGMFFELFSQRGSVFAPALAAHDVIAADCYAAIRKAAPLVFRGPLLKPLTYMEHGFSPATMRRGVALSRLLGEVNPFPVIRIPWDRDNPWQAVFLHEVAHNIQADLGLWQENMQALRNRILRATGNTVITSIYRRWHKEIFADVAAVLLGGPASAWGMMDFLANPSPRILTYKPGGVHPTGFIRILILAELLKRMGFEDESRRIGTLWRRLYDPVKGHRMPPELLRSSSNTIPNTVDEIVYQTRRNLAQRALVDVIPFTRIDEERIKRASEILVRGVVPDDLPPRFLVSASHYAIGKGADLRELSRKVIQHLSNIAARRNFAEKPVKAAAA